MKSKFVDLNSKLFCLIILILICKPSSAGDWTTNSVITEVYVNGYFVNVKLDGAKFNPDNCATNNTVYGLALDNPNYESMYSLLIASQMSKKKVKFYLSGCSGQNNSYPNIASIVVTD